MAFFDDHVSDVIRLPPERQMLKVDAPWVIASVHDDHSFRNITMRILENSTMRQRWRDATVGILADPSIASLIHMTKPLNAASRGRGTGLACESLWKCLVERHTAPLFGGYLPR
jgi:hypothetical protein